MNEIVRKSDAGGARNRRAAVGVEMIVAAQSRFAKGEPSSLSNSLWNILTDPPGRNSESYVRQTLAEAEEMLENPEYQRLLAGLKPAYVRPTAAEIKQQIGVLLLAFGVKDIDLGDFIEIAAAEIATTDPPVLRLRLAIAFRNLRRTAKFRPSISEMLDAIDEINLWHVGALLRLPDHVKEVRLRLARGDFAQRRVTQIAYDGAPDDGL
ncbi:hypothetical protein ACVI1L_001651 [Bradyrhizobium sp. USDA 4516]